jgi:hypothetical protein
VIRSQSECSTETDAKHCGLVNYTGHCGAWRPLHLPRLWSPRTGFATLHRAPLIAKIQQAATSSRTFSFFKHIETKWFAVHKPVLLCPSMRTKALKTHTTTKCPLEKHKTLIKSVCPQHSLSHHSGTTVTTETPHPKGDAGTMAGGAVQRTETVISLPTGHWWMPRAEALDDKANCRTSTWPQLPGVSSGPGSPRPRPCDTVSAPCKSEQWNSSS